MDERRITRHLSIRGRVQGVGFRETMRHEAQRLGVTGWVRNRLDGSVEAVIHGDAVQIAAMMTWVHRGPPAAKVLRVEEADTEGAFDRFDRLPTA